MPEAPARRASFELVRTELKDVRLVTFDELLEKLHLLRELLAGERYVAEDKDLCETDVWGVDASDDETGEAEDDDESVAPY